MTEITQADRDAAVDWYSPRESEWTGLLAEAFARHREQAERDTVEKIVAWLRGVDDQYRGEFVSAEALAERVEAGEWKQ